MNVYKIDDIISCEFLKIPKAMFANDIYRNLSSDAKLTYVCICLFYDHCGRNSGRHGYSDIAN